MEEPEPGVRYPAGPVATAEMERRLYRLRRRSHRLPVKMRPMVTVITGKAAIATGMETAATQAVKTSPGTGRAESAETEEMSVAETMSA